MHQPNWSHTTGDKPYMQQALGSVQSQWAGEEVRYEAEQLQEAEMVEVWRSLGAKLGAEVSGLAYL
jgi:hypothetical protein